MKHLTLALLALTLMTGAALAQPMENPGMRHEEHAAAIRAHHRHHRHHHHVVHHDHM